MLAAVKAQVTPDSTGEHDEDTRGDRDRRRSRNWACAGQRVAGAGARQRASTAGCARWDVETRDIDWDGEINIEDEIENFDEDDWELFYGVGVELNLGERFAIRAEWEEYDASEDLNTLSAGVLFRF